MSLKNITEEQRDELISRGFTLKEIQAAQYNELYREQYNKRPEVKTKRKAYNTKRYERMKTLREIAREQEAV